MERDIAIMEGEMNHSEDEYFKARPQIDTGHCRHLFRAGFERAWQAARAQPEQPSAGVVPERPIYSVDRHFLVELVTDRQKRIDDLELQLKQMNAAAPTAPAVQGGGVPEPYFWASEPQETEQLIDGRKRLCLWECKPGVGTPLYTHPHNGEQDEEWRKCSEVIPAIGQRVILKSNGVVQHYMPVLDAGDIDGFGGGGEVFWDFGDARDDDYPLVDFERDEWMPIPQPPKSKEDRGHE